MPRRWTGFTVDGLDLNFGVDEVPYNIGVPRDGRGA